MLKINKKLQYRILFFVLIPLGPFLVFWFYVNIDIAAAMAVTFFAALFTRHFFKLGWDKEYRDNYLVYLKEQRALPWKETDFHKTGLIFRRGWVVSLILLAIVLLISKIMAHFNLL